jgi:hypothetical protein
MLLTLLHSLVLLAKEANTTTSVCRCVTSVSRMVQKLARGHTRFATYVLEVCINVSNWSCHFNSRIIAIRKLSIVAKRTPEDGTH